MNMICYSSHPVICGGFTNTREVGDADKAIFEKVICLTDIIMSFLFSKY